MSLRTGYHLTRIDHVKPVKPLTETASSFLKTAFRSGLNPRSHESVKKKSALKNVRICVDRRALDKQNKTLHVHAFLYPHYFAVVSRPRLEHTRQRFLARAELLFYLLTLLLC